jgi:hypothetical protein
MEIYDDGFVYYCKEVFDPSNITMDNFITTGYIDRSIYEKNPLTIKDATNHMNVNHESFMNKIRLALQSVFTDTSIMRRATMLERYADTQIVSKGKRFLIFGADIALSKEKDIHIMEINKGPDLNAKDGRDGMLKKQMIETFMKKVIN